MGNHGIEGYADSKLVFGDADQPSNPEEAVAYQKARTEAYNNGKRVAYVVPVYSADGATQVDTFSVKLPPPPQEEGKR